MKKQTAVEWLQEAISKKLSSEIGPYFLDLFEQAKAMEEEQIIDSFFSGYNYEGGQLEEKSEQYYNQTFTEQPQK
jgi:hypothetical protein